MWITRSKGFPKSNTIFKLYRGNDVLFCRGFFKDLTTKTANGIAKRKVNRSQSGCTRITPPTPSCLGIQMIKGRKNRPCRQEARIDAKSGLPMACRIKMVQVIKPCRTSTALWYLSATVPMEMTWASLRNRAISCGAKSSNGILIKSMVEQESKTENRYASWTRFLFSAPKL